MDRINLMARKLDLVGPVTMMRVSGLSDIEIIQFLFERFTDMTRDVKESLTREVVKLDDDVMAFIAIEAIRKDGEMFYGC